MKSKLEALKGVELAVVTPNPPEAIVTFWPDMVSVNQMITAAKELGFGAKLKKDSCT